MAGRARIPSRWRSALASSKLTRRPYRAFFEWIDDYASDVVGRRGFDELLPSLAIQLIYEIQLGRPPDQTGLDTYLPPLSDGTMCNRDLLQIIGGSPEARSRPRYSARTVGTSLHESRTEFIRLLPRASRIVDLGGTDTSDPRGASVSSGYPYPFASLVVVDLPPTERHTIYQSDPYADVDTHLGPVSYRYHSMVELSTFADRSADLVYSGQSIEHVTAEEAVVVVKEVYRLLERGGWFALDTPNGRVTRLQQHELIDPDHKMEYTWPELSRLLTDAGFTIEWAKGLNYGGVPARHGRFDMNEVAANCGLFDEIEDCYLLGVVARKPF